MVHADRRHGTSRLWWTFEITKKWGSTMKLRTLIVLTASLVLAADDPAPLDILKKKAESDFILRDRNGDGFLNQDEMPNQLKAELSKWDTNRDNLISLDEYKFYYGTRIQNRRDGVYQPSIPVIIVEDDEDELSARPVVFRAGKLPTRDLPKWFMQLDMDNDGQVALSEWYKGGNDIEEFREWDRNDDGFITPEEALYKQRLIQVAGASTRSENGDSPTPALARATKSAPKGPNMMSSASDEHGPKGKKAGGFNKKRLH
jgi:hypothetical protein